MMAAFSMEDASALGTPLDKEDRWLIGSIILKGRGHGGTVDN